ncbi:glycosyltransferase [Azohydromonas caseinilytica]|uniref:Glycosyltransferase family 4 protein n=1 Tax=Azohydromonas caseinilytica TaxID=2728836 RepID=A0A848F4W9_9BURK|nr:glycosyltransferase [Azohydromonas caseinilytica]NML15097.1 glycosyltransferase family 4 protein [Azohydromonas caseinilytica]
MNSVTLDAANAATTTGAAAPPLRLLFTGDADSVHLQRWVLEMNRRGAECHVLTRRPAPVPGAAAVHAIRPGGDGVGWFLALPRVRALAARIAPDVVHGHYISSNGLWAAACGRRPLVLTAWGSDLLVTPRRSRAMRRLTGWILRRADLLTGDSRDLIEAMAEYGVSAPCEELLWGADTDRFNLPPPGVREARTFKLLSLRAWEPNYRIELILEAVALLRQRRPELPVRLILLGGGSLEAELRARADALGLQDCVRFLGRQDDAGMLHWMQRCHVSVSVPESDATSVSVLESMACGMALVTSDLPANRQWIDLQGGRLVPAGDARALADALQALQALPAEQLDAMGRHNRGVIVQRASRRQHMDRMYALYLRLAGRPVAEGAAP